MPLQRDVKAALMYAASRPLFEELALKPGDEFPLTSRSRRWHKYTMTVTPEGYVVHQGEGCEGEHFNDVRTCWHSQESEPHVTQALTPYQPSQAPVRLEFSEEQLKTITDVICVDSDGHRAPAAFVQLYLAACRRSGLDPFLRQIYALNIRGKWTMYVGIDGYRVISERTGLDEGMDGPQFSDDGQTWYDYPFVDQPAYCRVGIWRKGVPRAFIAVCTMKSKINGASDSWKKDPAGMLAKCTEALARRRAFPADMAVIPQEAVFDDADGAPITSTEVPDGQWREIAAQPEPAQPPPAERLTNGQAKAVSAAWGKASDKVRVEARQLWPKAFPEPGPGVTNNLAALSRLEADAAVSLLTLKEPVEEPASACEHDWAFNEDTTLMICGKCGVTQEEPAATNDNVPATAGLGI